ncbi:23S rRNA (guanosine(2251)-2'-O)-methyltransferase RlmB [Thermodesulfobacteriota bacterium]
MTHSPSKRSRKKNILSKQKQHRSSPAKDVLIVGFNSVLEALKASPTCVKEIIVDKGKKGLRLEELLDTAQQNNIPVIFSQAGKQGTLKKKPGFSEPDISQGVSARVELPTVTLNELLGKLKNISSAPLLLALDSIQDPHNLGAIIRSAVAAGVNGLILPKDRSASITGTVIKVSAGAVFHLDICRVTNLVNSFKILKEEGIWIFGAAKDTSQAVYDTDLTVPACLVIGSEGKGLRPLVAEHCDMYISIPMQGSLDSLNASVAAGIILFETARQRKNI